MKRWKETKGKRHVRVQTEKRVRDVTFSVIQPHKSIKETSKKLMTESVFASRQRQLEVQICLFYTFVSCLPQITLKGERARDRKKRMKAFRGNAV